MIHSNPQSCPHSHKTDSSTTVRCISPKQHSAQSTETPHTQKSNFFTTKSKTMLRPPRELSKLAVMDHLGLATNAITYTRITSTPYVCPVVLEPLGPNYTGTATHFAENRRAYNPAVASYHQVNLMQKPSLTKFKRHSTTPF